VASPRERLLRVLGALLLLVGGVALALAAGELATRVFWREPRASRPPLPEAWQRLPDLRTKGELAQPNLRVRNAGALYETNGAGFRGRERQRRKPDGVFRIALIGDSIAMGWGVAEADSYAARLEASLGPRFEVLNFGIAGLDALESIERFHAKALDFEPDLVVYGFTLNDLDNRHYRKSAADLGLVHRELMAHPSWLWARVLLPRLGALREVLVAPPGSPLFELDDNWFHNPAAWQTMLSALDRLVATMRERGGCAVLLIHPQLHYLNALHPYHRHYDAIARAAAERGFHVVNPIDDFLGRKDRRLWVADDDPHPGPEAHAMLAARLLREISALPAGCGLPTADPSLPPAASSLPPADPILAPAAAPPARG
jgi:lysophospholipase L1-like esterase